MKCYVLALAGLLLVLPAQAQEVRTVSGSVSGHDGEPLVQAHVHLLPATGREAVHSTEVEADGTYRIEVDTAGWFNLQFTAVDRQSVSVPLLLEAESTELIVDARLATYPYADSLDRVSLIGDFNDFSFQSGAVEMERQGDGTFVAEVEVDGDTLAYQLLNVHAEGRSINGTMSDAYVYDGGGDYRSLVAVEGGRARIVFDPSALQRSDATSEVTFADEEAFAARFMHFKQHLDALQRSFSEQYVAMRDDGATQDELDAFREAFDWSAGRARLEELLAAASTSMQRHALLIAYVTGGGPGDSTYAAVLLDELEPTSPFWSVGYGTLVRTVRATKNEEAYAAYLKTALEGHPDDDIRAGILASMMYRAKEAGDEEEAMALYRRLRDTYPESIEARMARSQMDPERAIQEGASAPAFAVTSLEDSTVTYSNESLRGQTYLIDFWAVWCGPCIAEMPRLHAAYEKYRDRGFTILSLSFDSAPQDVIDYRTGEFRMPWLHAFLDGGFQSDVAKRYEVVGIPKPILIGPDGRILATENALRGEKLEETLAGIFGGGSATQTPEPRR